MRDIQGSFQFVASLAALVLLTLVTLTLAGVFNGLTDKQAAFLGTLSGATVGFLGLLAGALYNARLNRAAVLADEEKRRLSCLRDLHARTRTLVTTFGIMWNLIQKANQITVDTVVAIERVIDNMRASHMPDLRLQTPDVLTRVHELNANLGAVEFMAVNPIKACKHENRVYQEHADARNDLLASLEGCFNDGIALRKSIAAQLGVEDIGSCSMSDVHLPYVRSVDR